MHYLPDAILFCIVPVLMVLVGLWNVDPGRTTLENLLLPGTLSLAAWGLLIWLAGLLLPLGWGLPLFALCLLPIAIAVLRRRSSHFSAQLRSLFSVWRGLPLIDLALVLYLLAIFGLTFVFTLAPPGGNDYDSLMYHLAAPRQYLRAGHVVELGYDHHTYFPFLTEMLFTFGLWARGPVFAKLFHWVMLPVCCGALAAMGQRHLSRRAGLVAAVLFATIPVVTIEATTAYIDLAFTAYVLLAFMCVANWVTTRQASWLYWAGAFCGFCLSSKYLGALTFFWLGVWILFHARRNLASSWRPVLGFAALTGLIGGGWYVRNWLWKGNPVFPFAYEIFGGRGWTLQMAKEYTADQHNFGFGRSVMDALWVPWRLAMAPLNFNQPFWPLAPQIVSDKLNFFETGGHALQTVLGPALLAFGVPALLLRRKPQLVVLCLSSFAFFFLFWFATGQYLRYLLPAFALMCVPCAWAATRLATRGSLLKLTVAIALGAWLLFVPYWFMFQVRGIVPVVTGAETPDRYLARTCPPYAAMQWASQNTPDSARFAIYGEPRCFYLERDYFWADNPHNQLIDYEHIADGKALIGALRGLGATHVLVNADPEHTGGAFTAPPQFQDAVEKRLVQFKVEANGYQVYEIANHGR